jgi:cytochrome c
MKVATLSTLWDYINRAMPWTAPKSLTTEEVYAVTAFLLNLGGVVPDEFTLSDQNMAEVQKKMPNRNGMNTQHAMWPGNEFSGTQKADTQNTACMKNCVTEASVSSLLPEFARNSHGNLADQNRAVGAQHGVDTTQPGTASVASGAKPTVPAAPESPAAQRKTPEQPQGVDAKAVQALLQKYSCTACHAQATKVVGPSFSDIAKKHAGKPDYLAGKIKSGGSGVWGAIPMPPQSLTDAEAKSIAAWLAAGAVR